MQAQPTSETHVSKVYRQECPSADSPIGNVLGVLLTHDRMIGWLTTKYEALAEHCHLLAVTGGISATVAVTGFCYLFSLVRIATVIRCDPVPHRYCDAIRPLCKPTFFDGPSACHSTGQLTSHIQEENHEEILQEQILFLAEQILFLADHL